jgi:hypothetical protein
MEKDGLLGDGTLGSSLFNNVYYLDSSTIRQNLTNQDKDLGVTLQVPDFEKYIHAIKQNTSWAGYK